MSAPSTRPAVRPPVTHLRLISLLIAALLGATGTLLSPVPAYAEATVNVEFTNIGIYPRAAPSMGADKVGAAISDGTPVTINCETEAEPVDNGYQTIAIWDRLSDGTWLPNAFLDTGTTSWTPGVPRCDDAGASSDVAAPTETTTSTASHLDPCLVSFPGGRQSSTDVFGGSRTAFDRIQSLYQVCSGFGAPAGLELTPAMKCTLIAAAATIAGPELGLPVNAACDAAEVVSAIQSGDWLGLAASKTCSFLATAFATAGGIATGGATAETGPGAAAVGVATYRAISATLHTVCGAFFDGGANSVGVKIEADHETRIAEDVLTHGSCIYEDVRFGLIFWSAASC